MRNLFLRLAASALLVVAVAPALAQEQAQNCYALQGLQRSKCLLGQTRTASGFGATEDPVAIAGNIIQTVLSVMGILFLALTIYGGYLWMTARGEEEQVRKGKNTIERAATGLVVILAAYAITTFVVEQLVGATGAEAPGAEAPLAPGGGGPRP